jgi:transposase
MANHPPIRLYGERRTTEGLSKLEIIRCLKRYVAREVFPLVRTVGHLEHQAHQEIETAP